MFDPETILTEAGYRDLIRHVGNMEEALNFLLNHASDLRIGSLDDKQSETLHRMNQLCPLLLKGDGEEEEEDNY